MQVLQAAIQEENIVGVFALLRAHGVEPILMKGWAVERLYAQPALRPSADIDLSIRPSLESLARLELARPEASRYPVDIWHEELDALDDTGWDELYARSQLVKLGVTDVRVLGPEDQLALLCLHFMRHGGWRPLWLCDIGAALEARPDDFDWDLCLGRDRRRAEYIRCALGLAHQLLGARIDDTPEHVRNQVLPRWLVPAVLKQWEGPYHNRLGAPEFIMVSLRDPALLLRTLREHWHDPIQATVRTRGPMNDLPRFPFQLYDYAAQVARFAMQLPGKLRDQR